MVGPTRRPARARARPQADYAPWPPGALALWPLGSGTSRQRPWASRTRPFSWSSGPIMPIPTPVISDPAQTARAFGLGQGTVQLVHGRRPDHLRSQALRVGRELPHVFRRELALDLVDDFFSGPILLSWQKLRVWAEQWRREQNRETGSEWFHWLAERMMEREKLAPPDVTVADLVADDNFVYLSNFTRNRVASAHTPSILFSQ